ncbi:hypothetical protein PEp14_00059 [Erwinia phage PEp14]|uniref:Uncharacterized protein n=1 Tax=Erwinia phage PEp14 TaxID=1131315 RepID=H2DE89_9CAUD|nr:hypothetical protein PEp14_00059 [Erwinia phage PEp14]AEY69648.1 hypothetical protein PEp14_00059 [Erwinia phage PEp14]
MLVQAAAQIDMLSSAAVKWQDQSARIDDLNEIVVGYQDAQENTRALTRQLDVILNGEDGAAEQAALADIVSQLRDGGWKLVQAGEHPGEDVKPSHDMQQLVDEACVMFGIESYAAFLPKLADVQELMTRQNDGLMQRDRQLEALDRQLIEAKDNHQQAKVDYSRLHALLDTICEKTTVPDIRFDQLPRAIEVSFALFNDTLEAAGVDAQDADDLPETVRGLKESHRTAVSQRDDARSNVDELRAAMRRVALTLGLTDPSVQDVLDAIESLLGSDNVTTPAADESWLNEAIDLCHAVAGDLSRENAIMARAARNLIQTAPRGEHE